jgi:hypothetical protein
MTERMMQVQWTLDHLDDLESDFAVIYRVDDIMSMHSAEFFRKAQRLGSYQGVMAAIASKDSTASTTRQSGPRTGVVSARDVKGVVQVDNLDTLQATAPDDPVLGPLMSRSVVSG